MPPPSKPQKRNKGAKKSQPSKANNKSNNGQAAAPVPATTVEGKGWATLNLNDRIVEALLAQGWARPTAVQRAVIPHALRGGDIAVESRTGSGKTGAFCIPMVQRIIVEKIQAAAATAAGQKKKGGAGAATADSQRIGPAGLILVPSVEMCKQTNAAVRAVTKFCRPKIVCESLGLDGTLPLTACMDSLDILVSTPSQLARLLKNAPKAPTPSSVSSSSTQQQQQQQMLAATLLSGNFLSQLRVLVVDECDVLVSMTSMRIVQSSLPSSAQTILLSATLTDSVATLRGQLSRHPTVIKLEETEDDDDDGEDGGGLSTKALLEAQARQHGDGGESDEDDDDDGEGKVETVVKFREDTRATLKQHYVISTDGCHQHTILYALFRLKLIQGKTLIFVEDEADTYRLQHFLEQLAVSSVVYDTELPKNVRMNILQRFQMGSVATMICTDGTLERAESMRMQSVTSKEQKQSLAKRNLKRAGLNPDGSKNDDDEEEDPEMRAVSGQSSKQQLHRGIDFTNVKNVIIFDGMSNPSAINLHNYTHRIGRTGRAGQSGNSIIIMGLPQSKRILHPLREYVRGRGENIRPFKELDRDKAASLQYRVDTALANVTRVATKRLRVATVAAEMARSDYLTSHMNTQDNAALTKIVDRARQSVKTDVNVVRVPEYMGLPADAPSRFAQRVNAMDKQKKEHLFDRIVKRHRTQDPLKEIVRKVRRKDPKK